MSNVARVASTAANVLTTPPNIEDVFSTQVYDGDGTTSRNIVNNLDVLGEGGLLWFKTRSTTGDHILFDTVRGGDQRISTNSTNENTNSDWVSFLSNGFNIKTNVTQLNYNNYRYVNWAFRKAPKFFDIQTWSGNDTNPRVITHNLGCQAGFVLIKDITGAGTNWIAAHHSEPTEVGYMTSGAFFTANYINTLTSSSFTLGDNVVNSTGRDYIAYIWAHNDSDGGFGPTGDKDIIKCGKYTGNGATDGHYIDIGFEPQFLILKKYNTTGNWSMWDNMRGVGTYSDHYIYPHSSTGETDLTPNTINRVDFTTTGFGLMDNDADTNSSSHSYFYIAIRRGPMATPTSATDVFSIATAADLSNAPPTFISGFPVDFSMYKRKDATQDWNVFDRVRGDARELNTNSTGVETAQAGTYYNYDYMNGIGSNTTSTNANSHQFMWRRAPKFFDIVAWTGDGTTSRQISHDLGVQPQWMMMRPRDATSNWLLWFAALGDDHYFPLTDDTKQSSAVFINTADSTSFTLGTGTSLNASGVDHIAWLFGSLDGVSKVGSYTGDGSYPRTIDCGFTSGARFIMIKNTTRTSGARSWYIWDTTRGIVAGNDPHLVLNTSAPEDGSFDDIDPHDSGFTIAQGGTQSNNNGDTFVFYAIA